MAAATGSGAPFSAPAATPALQLLAGGAAVAGGASAGTPPEVGALLAALSASALAGTAPGAPATISLSSLPPISSAPYLAPPNCAPAVALSIVRVPVGSVAASRVGNWSITIGAPLPQCGATLPAPELGGARPPFRAMQLPPAVIALQPPPTLTLSYATLAWLTRAGGPVAAPGAASVDFRLVQWGAPPIGESAGVGGIAYPPAAEGSAPVDAAASGGALARARRRQLGVLSAISALFSPSSWAAMVSSAFTATQGALNAAAPPPQRRDDRLPSRLMDTRVFIIEVSSGGGPPNRAAAPWAASTTSPCPCGTSPLRCGAAPRGRTHPRHQQLRRLHRGLHMPVIRGRHHGQRRSLLYRPRGKPRKPVRQPPARALPHAARQPHAVRHVTTQHTSTQQHGTWPRRVI